MPKRQNPDKPKSQKSKIRNAKIQKSGNSESKNLKTKIPKSQILEKPKSQKPKLKKAKSWKPKSQNPRSWKSKSGEPKSRLSKLHKPQCRKAKIRKNIYHFFDEEEFICISITFGTILAYLQHSMVYFFHHYELPVIIHQAQLQQLLMRSRHQNHQNGQQGNAGANPSNAATNGTVQGPNNAPRPATGEARRPGEGGNRQNDNNNNNHNFFTNVTYLARRLPVPGLRNREDTPLIRSIRNLMANTVLGGLINNNENNNNPRIRVVNLGNLQRISLGRIAITPTTVQSETQTTGGDTEAAAENANRWDFVMFIFSRDVCRSHGLFARLSCFCGVRRALWDKIT